MRQKFACKPSFAPPLHSFSSASFLRSGLWINILHRNTQCPSCASNPTLVAPFHSPANLAGGRCVRCACEALRPRVSRQAQTDASSSHSRTARTHVTYWVLLQVQAAAGGVQRAPSRPQQRRAAAGAGVATNTYVSTSAAAALHASNTVIPTQTHLVRPLSCRRPVQQVECVRGAATCSTAQWAAMDHGAVAGQQVGSSAVSAAYTRLVVLCGGCLLCTYRYAVLGLNQVTGRPWLEPLKT